MRTGFLAFTLLVLGSSPALAAPFDNITTHNTAVPEQSFQLAATWFLPDWQASMSGRSESAPDKSGDRHDLTCSTYDGCDGVPVNMTCSENFTAAGTTCYKSCSCKSGYNRVNDSDVCSGCANPCDTVTAVSAPYGCQTAWTVCPSKCQVAYPDNCRNRNAVTATYGCEKYFSDCSTKCEKAYPDNCHNRTAVATPYGCQTYFSDCSSKCQTAYPDNCRNYSSKPLATSCINGCAQGKTLSDCSSRCSTGCKAKCETGYHLSSDQLSCQIDSCPSGYEAGKTCGKGYNLEKSGQSGTQYCGKCTVKACTSGTTSCSANLMAMFNGYYSGEDRCYDCLPKTCDLISCPNGQTCNPSTFKCEAQTCKDFYQKILDNCDKCAIDATEFNNTVETIIFTKDTNLKNIVINPAKSPRTISFQSLLTFGVPACANEKKPVLSGSLNVPSGIFITSIADLELFQADIPSKRLTIVNSSVSDSTLIATEILKINAQTDLSGHMSLVGGYSVDLYMSSGMVRTLDSLSVSAGSFRIIPENTTDTKKMTINTTDLMLYLSEPFNPENLNLTIENLSINNSVIAISPILSTFKVKGTISLAKSTIEFYNPLNNRLNFQNLILDDSYLRIYNSSGSNISFSSLISYKNKTKYPSVYISNNNSASYIGNQTLAPRRVFDFEFPSGYYQGNDFARYLK